MYFSKIAPVFLALACSFVSAYAAEPACRPFRIHKFADLPIPPREGTPAYADLTACISHYTSLDMNKNGISDWTANIGGQVSDVLFPNDPDLDGDGVLNMLDPAPLDPVISKSEFLPSGVPKHLAIEGVAGALQEEIFRKFGILAVDHTDHHAAPVLEALRTVLRSALSDTARTRIKSVKYIYAFSGHDAVINVAAYHRQAEALSIGGISAYGTEPLREGARLAVLAAVAHELGHAFLFDQMSAHELGTIGIRFGNWKGVVGSKDLSDFHDSRFFRAHPFRNLARLAGRNKDHSLDFINRTVFRESNLASEYATTNIHEWFADAFAASLLHRLGEEGFLGGAWRTRLARLPAHPGGYWVNYNNITYEFRAWMNDRLLLSVAAGHSAHRGK